VYFKGYFLKEVGIAIAQKNSGNYTRLPIIVDLNKMGVVSAGIPAT